MSNSDHSFNGALLNSISMGTAETGKIAVAADIQDEPLMHLDDLVLNGDFKFEEPLQSVPSSSSSSMFPCDESSFPPIMHISPSTSPDFDKVRKLLNDDEGFQTPSTAIVSVEPTSSESQQRRRRRRRLDLVPSDDQEKRPNWLPLDWQVEYRRREGGATAGLTDRYYYEPGSRRQFRSKKEVLCYLETGLRRRCKGKSQEKSNNGVLSEQNGSSLGKRKRGPLNYNFDSPLKKVSWVMNTFPEAPGTWTSIISGEMQPGHTRQQWDAAFMYHVQGVVASNSIVDEVAVNLEAGA